MQELVKRAIPLSTNHAIANAVKDLDVDVISAYPITPQTTVVEKISEFIAKGELDAEYIHVESEHSALSAAISASLTGARAFTATASQGFALMHEMLHIASGLRAPVVMSVAMRSLSAPISIWNDQSDLFNARDSGWIIIFAHTAQEAYDTVIQSYKIAEDHNVLLPVMVGYDGYVMSHTIEPVITEDKEKVLKFAPKKQYPYKLDPDKPVSIGSITPPEYYYEFKYQQVKAINGSLPIIEKTDEDFGKTFGRSYGLMECYMCEDADSLIMTNASYASTLKAFLPEIRKQGLNVGLLRLRVYRPFPLQKFIEYTSDKKNLLVIDRAISYGAPYQGPLANEISGAMVRSGLKLNLISVVTGIGQRTVEFEDFLALARLAHEGRKHEETIFYGVRE
ncbi:2-oxoacid:ferredoxin oxidoreductase, alpha subunit [Caldisphaera lagunensis DSM 15908]|uniref:2-oxoacid oxidoreductase (ferredoxin) n=1 Tax=Caldisphaera lagunensis (strain DSM 15908 / JCM 11604 / ANMR 0165 / IC-154) TaxID=1056495 RepID=L0ACE9_CALLD|nr:2-oxoacid:ferredoxin oxidoreductase subunit alpha [Caldisphaera lagunensis]AFZ70812.1 2-oxoacid:ferredoxin oxidoreductase, alpha subunit [Caldisphaera lagunensis DSM 15908]